MIKRTQELKKKIREDKVSRILSLSNQIKGSHSSRGFVTKSLKRLEQEAFREER